MQELKIFAGTASIALTQEITQYLEVPLGRAEISLFSDGEIFVQINENVRGADVFVVQSTCTPGNKNLMELLIMIDALKRASAWRITAVLPYYGYARQDRKVQPRVPITAKLIADLLVAAGTDRLLAMDLHAGQIQGFFNIPVDHLFAAPVMLDYVKAKNWPDIVVISPDAGGVERARAFAKRLPHASLAIIDKRRVKANVAELMNIVGDVENKNAIILDDIVDTAGTITQAASALKERGSASIVSCCTHPVLSGPAYERIQKSEIEELVVTNTIDIPTSKQTDKIVVLSIAELLGEAIRRIHTHTTVSSLFV